jgi:hypothetical protein
VFEIYPKRFEDETITTVRFGFTVPSVDGTVKRLREQSAQVLTEAHDSPWGPRAVVQDLEPQDPDPETAAFISDSALHEAVAVAPGFAPRDGYPASFSPTLMTARYGSCLQVGMSRYQRMRRAGRILPLYGFAEHSRRSTSPRGIMIRPH